MVMRMRRKAVADAAAYIRGLAQLRGRNAEWAEKAVREAVSLPPRKRSSSRSSTLSQPTCPICSRRSTRKTSSCRGRARAADRRQRRQCAVEPDWRSRLLAVITDPSIAYILMLLGIYGLLFEFYNPGLVLPGVVGAICLLVALYALQMLPVNYAGLALILSLASPSWSRSCSCTSYGCARDRRGGRVRDRLGDADRYRRAGLRDPLDADRS